MEKISQTGKKRKRIDSQLLLIKRSTQHLHGFSVFGFRGKWMMMFPALLEKERGVKTGLISWLAGVERRGEKENFQGSGKPYFCFGCHSLLVKEKKMFRLQGLIK
jgi:hypothetical protein